MSTPTSTTPAAKPSTFMPSNNSSLSNRTTISTFANDWDPLELWLDSVSLDIPSSCVDDHHLLMDMDIVAPSPSTPNASVLFFQSVHEAEQSTDDYDMFDFSDSLFMTDFTMTTPQLDESNALLSFMEELQKSAADFVSMEVSASEVEPPQPKRSTTASCSPLPVNAKKPRLNSSKGPIAGPVPVETRLHVRKVKQRGYEREYRGRLRTKRVEDEALWMELEVQLRSKLAEKRVVHMAETLMSTSSEGLMRECIELAHEVRALEEEKAFRVAYKRWIGALHMWGETEANRWIRYQINALPKLRGCPTFINFTW